MERGSWNRNAGAGWALEIRFKGAVRVRRGHVGAHAGGITRARGRARGEREVLGELTSGPGTVPRWNPGWYCEHRLSAPWHTPA